ncbi:hypothetical protein SAMN02910342_02737 [Butyrivibrio sp. INlla21]|nr:hypothetical protein SAMN02910342_02737 [Butyrivibrio sp. INlla21]
MIAPALERSESARIYYDEWGGRTYLFSAYDENIWKPVKTMAVTDNRLFINTEAFRKLGGRYIFSRIKISNVEDLGFDAVGCFTDGDSPYEIYVYRLAV